MPSATDLRDFRRGAEWALVVATAQEAGVFEALRDGALPPAELARRTDLHPRGLDVLLGVLEELGMVRREPGGGVLLSGTARAHLLDADTPDYQADALRLWLLHLRDWAENLPESLRTGIAPPDREEDEEERKEALVRFQAAMANKSPELVASVVEAALERAAGTGRFLDLGGGPGVFSRALLKRGWRGVLMDRPEVIEHVADRYGLAGLEGLRLEGGDFLETLPEGPFDLILVANISHIFDPPTNRRLLRRLAGRLAPGGTLALLDFVRGVEPFAALFAVTMLMNTERGGTYPLSAYRRWLEEAGLEAVRCRTVREERQVITALRPG